MGDEYGQNLSTSELMGLSTIFENLSLCIAGIAASPPEIIPKSCVPAGSPRPIEQPAQLLSSLKVVV